MRCFCHLDRLHQTLFIQCQTNIVLQLLWNIHMQLCKPKLCCHDKALFPDTCKQVIPVSFFCKLCVTNLNTLRHVECEMQILVFFSLSTGQSDLMVNVPGPELLGRLATVSNVFHLCRMTDFRLTGNCFLTLP